jgi:hypothetical protein
MTALWVFFQRTPCTVARLGYALVAGPGTLKALSGTVYGLCCR